MGEILGLFATMCAFISGSILGSAAFSSYKTSRHKNTSESTFRVFIDCGCIVDFFGIARYESPHPGLCH